MESLLDPGILAGLVTLVILEIILGIDNLIFIAILADRLPPEQRDRARKIGLGLALFMRLALLAGISWLVTLTAPLVTWGELAFSGRDLILLGGGLFLLYKATMEIHDRLEGADHVVREARGHARFWPVVAQIIVLDAVFSLDSVITAVGMVGELWVMMTAVTIAMIVMIAASRPLTAFVGAHPTVIMLCLGFLLMVGFSLIAEGFHFDIPKGYLYAAIAFSILVETFNQIRVARQERRHARLPLRQRTVDAVLRLLGGRPELVLEPAPAGGRIAAMAAATDVFAPAEREMIAGVMRLGERSTRSIMTPRPEIVWLDAAAPRDALRQHLLEHGHSRYPVCRGTLDDVLGILHARDLWPRLLAAEPLDLATGLHPPLVVPGRMPAIRLSEQLRTTPTRLALVVDEHGGIDGLVTATDLLGAIARDLVEDEDAAARPVRLADGSLQLDGLTPLQDAAHFLGRTRLDAGEDYATIAGFVLQHLGRIPAVGDGFEWDGLRFTITGMDDRRIDRVVVAPAR
jgi:CBS domain containing-hemolysin-like protein